MAVDTGVRTDPRPASQIERLIRERGLRRFGLFFVTGEGEDFPNGDEETSGYVVDSHGQIYSFWTGWDETRREVLFTEWGPVAEEPEWIGVREYERARMLAGVPPTFEEILDSLGWLTVPEMVARLEVAGYWLRHPTVLSRRAKQRHVEELLHKLSGPHGIPLFIRALRPKTVEFEYIHPLSAKSDDIRREGRFLLEESLKLRQTRRHADTDHRPRMAMKPDGRLVIGLEQDVDTDSVDRARHLLRHLTSPDEETIEEDETDGMLSLRLRNLIESGRVGFTEGVAMQGQQSMRVHLRRTDGMRLLAQLMAALDLLGYGDGEDNIVSRAYEAGLFAV